MGSVKLSMARPDDAALSKETPDQALDRALKKVREARRRRDQVILRTRPSRSVRAAS